MTVVHDADPIALRDLPEPEKGRAGRAFEQARLPEEWPLASQAAVYWTVSARISEKPRRARVALGFGVAAMACAAAALVFLEPLTPPLSGPGGALEAGWTRVDIAEVGVVEISPRASFDLRELDTECQLHIAGGILRAQIHRQDLQHPVVVVTPHIRVVVVGTRFDVHVSPDSSEVQVLQGQVRVESVSGSATVSAGESIRGDDPRLKPPPAAPLSSSVWLRAGPASPELSASSRARAVRPEPRAMGASPPEETDCRRVVSFDQQKSCYLRQARGDGLAAQNALYELGLLVRDVESSPEQALKYFGQYQERFPNGVLAPEVALAVLETLKEQGRASEAAAAARAFEERFAGDTRVVDVALVRAELLCAQRERRKEALELLARIEREVPSMRDKVARIRERCPAADRTPDPLQILWGEPRKGSLADD
jgi:hypothetical protein